MRPKVRLQNPFISDVVTSTILHLYLKMVREAEMLEINMYEC